LLGYKIFSLEKLDIYTNLKSIVTQICAVIESLEPKPYAFMLLTQFG